jgi:hypothetical protein
MACKIRPKPLGSLKMVQIGLTCDFEEKCGVLSYPYRRPENGADAECTVSSGANAIPSVESDHLLHGE